MNKTRQHKQATRGRYAARLGIICAWLLLSVSVGQPQPQSKPSIAGEVKEDDKKKSDAGSKRQSDPRATRRHTPAAALLDITFVTGLADSDIFVQGPSSKLQSLGKTGADGRLRARMPRGVYNITASRAGYTAQRQQISVQPNRTTFVLNLTGRPLAGGTDAPANTADVIKRFLDPQQTAHVTASDWQLVQQQTSVAFAQNPNDAQTKAQALFAQGQLAYLRGDYAGALVAFNNSALALPSSALAYYGLGNAYLATNQLPEAFRAYQHAVELNGELAMAFVGLGDVLSKQGKDKAAVSYYERAKALGYTSPNANLNTARNLMKREHWSEALKELTDIAKAQPTAEVFIAIGDCYVELKQPLSAAPAYRRAMELDPKSALANAKYGELMLDAREYTAAAEALERALALDPNGNTINRNRARKLANQAAQKLRNAK